MKADNFSKNGKRGKRKAHGSNGRRRKNCTGTIEKRGEKWLARFYIRNAQGQRVRISKMLKATSLDEARKELYALTEGNALMTREKVLKKYAEELEGVRAALRRIEDEKPALAVSDMFGAYKRSPNRPQAGESTLKHYEGEINRFSDWIASKYPEVDEMRKVSRVVANDFLSDLSARVSPNTYNKHLSLFRLVWRTLGEEAKCTVNPWEGVQRKIQPKTNGRRALTIEELAKVTADLTGEMRLLFAVGIFTGLRLGDCALLDWGKIDIVRRVIITTPRKTARTGKAVEIPIHPTLVAMLADVPEQNRVGYLLPETAGAYLRDDSAVTKRIQAIFERAGIVTKKEVAGYSQAVAGVGFHSLRHTFVSLMGNAGAPLALVQSIVGHSSPMMTSHYFHARTEAVAKAINNLPSLIGEPINKEAKTTQPPEIALQAENKPVENRDAARHENIQPGEESRLEAFYRAFGALSDEEKETARQWVNSRY